MRASTTASTGPAHCSGRWSTRDCSARRAAAVFTTTRDVSRRGLVDVDALVERINDFIGRHAGHAPESIDTDIFEQGYVSSIFSVNILTWVEKTFGLEVLSEDLRIDNFRTVRSIADFIERKQAASATQ
ncbi:acyl carrier protein [Microbispora cellulosiformans]|uniref:Acyl carrier protein n=1 Tax=Microbispora cellulosiformans TaxID=2614688 RepID=A0A5J5JTS1_9ACTN|nr:acyl carrier protein [Microbispora cellulosiformans]